MGDVVVVEDETVAYDDGHVAGVRVLAVPESETFPEGIKYKFHYGTVDAENPIIRYDNHHGKHERHSGADSEEIDFPGLRRSSVTGATTCPRTNERTGNP